jgi:hypothetical protein
MARAGKQLGFSDNIRRLRKVRERYGDLNWRARASILRGMLSVRMALAKGFLFFGLAIFGAAAARGGELLTPSSFAPPKVAEASNEGELAMKGFVLPEGLTRASWR